MGNFCACTITTSPQTMLPRRVVPIHTNCITKPLHTMHTGHVSATVSVSIYCVRRAEVAPRTALRAPRGQKALELALSLGAPVWHRVTAFKCTDHRTAPAH